MQEEATRLRDLAFAAERFATANRDGFRKILKKYDRRSAGAPLSPRYLPAVGARGFALDAAEGQSGRPAVLRQSLTRQFHLSP